MFVCTPFTDKLRGFGRKAGVMVLYLVWGLLGLAEVPLFNGYISKTLIHESIVNTSAWMPIQTVLAGTLQTVEALFTFAGGLHWHIMLEIVCSHLYREKS